MAYIPQGGTLPSINTFQAKIATTGTAVQLPSNAGLINGVLIAANSNNVASIMIGGSGVTNTNTGSGNGVALAPGATLPFAVNNTNVLYINGTAGDFITVEGN